jgi:hypothetical protein
LSERRGCKKKRQNNAVNNKVPAHDDSTLKNASIVRLNAEERGRGVFMRKFLAGKSA